MKLKMTKTVKKLFAAVLAVVMLAAPVTLTTEAKQKYPQVDAFAEATTLKGLQGVDTYGYGSQHDIRSFFIEECILSADHEWVQKGYVLPFEYEGENYYFSLPKNPFDWLKKCNDAGITTSIVFLTRYNESTSFMIDEASRVPGYTYYAPATTGEGAKQFKALFAYLCELCIQEGCHIDNFILGNEVNMPNQWHYSGTTDPYACANKYADAFYNMYSVVRQYSEISRCSISLDHSWQHNDEGRGIAAKDFLNIFAARLNTYSPDIDWCISYHMYPAILFETDIWATNAHITAEDLNPKNDSARFVDGNNLSVMTNYVKNTFGEQHRIMLTEQGFSNYYGADWQAASLAYSYYAAMYDPMVDSFLLNIENAGSQLDFRIDGTKAAEVYKKIASGSAEDQAWIDANILPTIGVNSWADIVPNYGQEITRYRKTVTPDLPDADETQVTAFVSRLYEKVLGRTADETGIGTWVPALCERDITGAAAAQGFFFSEELLAKNLSNEDFVELLYVVLMDRASDPVGKAQWVGYLDGGTSRLGVFRGFAESVEFTNICTAYGIERGNAEGVAGRDLNPGLTAFVARLYTQALGRSYDDSIDMWCTLINNGEWSINRVSTEGFFDSAEFVNKGLNDEEYVKVLYNTFLGREADGGGLAFWVEQLQAGMSRTEVLSGFSESVEFAGIKAGFGL